MSFDAGAITGTLGLDISPFTSAMLQSQTLMSLFPGWVTGFMVDPLLGVTAAAREAAGAILALGNEWDNMGEAADRTGTDVTWFSSVAKAAEDSGVSLGGFEQALTFMNRASAEARQGDKELGAAFRDLGVSLGDLAALKPEELFYRLADSFAAIDDPGQRTALMMKILGRGGAEMGAFLKGGAAPIAELAERIAELGGATSSAQAKMGDSWGRMTTLFKAALTGIQAAVAEPILQMFGDDAEQVTAKVKELAGQIIAGLKTAMDQILPVLKFVIAHFQQIVWLLSAAVLGKSIMAAVGMVQALGGSFLKLAADMTAATAAQQAFNAASALKGMAGSAGIGGAIGAGAFGSMGGTIGGIGGSILGGLLGTVFGPIGMWLGRLLGGAAGGFIGDQIGQAFSPGSSGGASGGGGNTYNVNVSAPMDVNDSAGQIAGKMIPALREVRRQQDMQTVSIAQMARVKANL